MNNKENDYFLELMSNPTFSPKDFLLVGLSSENTGILDASIYKKAKIVQENPLFQTDGKFDENKFDKAYEQALYQYNDLARLTETSKPFFRDDIFAPDTLKGKEDEPEFTVHKVQNPLRQQESFVSFGNKEAPTQSVREIAESNPTYDYKTGKWTDSPNETWFDNFLNPKVLAQWDFDADENGNPTNDPEKVVFHKGEKKIDSTTGTFYYETLGDRDIYGREVLSGFDTLTVDGSTANKFDFFDSDDIDKSVGGSMARAVAQIVPVFIPYIGEIYVGSRIALSMSELIPTIGKIFTGSDNEFLSKIEGINKAMSFSTSDYTQGSAEAGIEANPWTAETGLKLIADVFTQLAEQRWIFKYGSALFAGVNPKIIGETELAQLARQALIERNAAKAGFKAENYAGRSAMDLIKLAETERAVNFARAKTTLDKQLKHGQELAKHLSMAYMTGITTASSYGEAKQQGASDVEAALFALGYTAGEYALLSSDLGQWILPELKLEKYQNQQIARALSRVTREAGNANLTSTVGKQKWYKNLFNYGKQLASLDYSDSVLKSAAKMTTSSMLSEGIEETSEEVLLDLSKTLFNAANSLRGDDTRFDDAWSDMATRYGMSFIGGTVGGGIATALPGYRAARSGRTIKDSDAYKQLVNIVSNGQSEEFLNTMNKMDLGNKDLSIRVQKNSDGTVSYKPAENYTDSQDYAIKQELTKQVKMIDDILNSEGAKISQDSLLNDKLIRRELKYHSLLLSNVLGVYTNEFNNLLSDLVDTSKEINELETAKAGNNPERTDAQNREDKKEFTKADELKLNDLKKQQKSLRDKLELYKDGSMANEFIGEALFELDTQISSAYAPTDFRRWVEEQSGKDFVDLSETELKDYRNKWTEASINRRDIIHRAYQVFKKNQKALADVIKKHEEEYFLLDNVIKDLEKTFMEIEGELAKSKNIVEDAQIFIPADARSRIWKGLLTSMKDTLSKDVYDNFTLTYNNLGVTYEQSLNLESLPTSVEELNKMKPEDKQKLLDDLFQGEQVVEPTLDLELTNLIQNRLKEYQAEKYEEFKSGWAVFLSNQQVQDEFVKTLEQTHYITPTTKQYIKDFVNRADITDSAKLKMTKVLDKVPNSPTEELLSNMVSTLQSTGIDTTGMITDLAAFMSDLANSYNIENFSYSPEMDLKIRKTIDLIEIAHSHIEAAKTEIYGDLGNLYGYNATINELQEKYPGKDNIKLTLIQAPTANNLLHELARIHKDLRFYQEVFNANTNTKLTDHIKTDLKLNTLYFGNLKRLSTEIPDDWEGKNEVNEAINQATTLQAIIDNGKESLTRDERVQMNKERLAIEQSLYNLFLKNLDKDLSKLFKSFNLVSSTQNLLNSGVQSQTDRDFIWYLASIAAANPTLVTNEFKNSINSKYAPIIAQEEAIKRAYSYLLNPQVFEKFAQAYNEAYKEQLSADRTKRGDSRTDLDTPEYLLSTRHFLIEGIPGSGKSSATYLTLYNMLKAYHPELLLKVWFVSNSKKNAENASQGMDNITAMSKEEYFRKIGINYNQEYDENGLIKTDSSKMIEDENGINHFKDVTINEGVEAPTLILFDETSSFSQQDLLLSEDFLKAKGVYALTAGDFDQIGAQGEFKDQNGQTVFVKLSNSNFMGSWKLGSSMRSNNVYKSKNIATARESIKEFPKKLGLYNQGVPMTDPIRFSYYESNEGLYGDKVVTTDNDQEWEKSIRTMLDTLEDSEVLNFISDDSSTKLYQTLKALNENGKYKGKINFLDAKTSQGQEGQYYVIELNKSLEKAIGQANPDVNGDNAAESSVNYGKTIYTAISRAKQGSLVIYDDSSVNDPLFESIKQNTLQVNNLSQQIVLKFGEERKALLEEILGDINETTKLNRGVPTSVEEETTEPTEENFSGDDITEEETTRNNLDKPTTISNKKDGELNIMLHSFMCQETGCDIEGGNEPTDPNVKLRLGEFYENRTDNLNGLAQIEKRSGGKINISGIRIENGVIVEGKDILLKKLNTIRNLACYTKNKSDLIGLIQQQLGTNVPIRVDFVYKNQFRSYKGENQTRAWFAANPNYLKFYKGKSEYLAGIFNESNIGNEIREPKDLVIEAIITLDDGTQLVEVPLAKMTSPLTLLNSSEFEGIRDVFDKVNQDVSKFKREIKKLLQQNSSIPHLKEYAMLLELWENSSYNTISYFPDDFTLAKVALVTGITTTSSERGKDYFKTLGYYYDGKWMTLDDYKQRMPWRTMSRIFSSVETNGRKVVELNGSQIQVGKPFVLVSDYYSDMSDEELLNTYLKQCKDKSEPLVRLVYVTPPTATMQEYIFNLNNALTKNGNNFENVDKDLGTKITAFRLLQFALADNSSFRAAFAEWNDSTQQANKQASMNRLEAISNLVKSLTTYEEKEGKGKLYELLNTPLKNVNRNITGNLKYDDGGNEKWIMSTSSTLTLRHVLQQELHKMVLSEIFYGDSLQSKMLAKKGNDIVFSDVVNKKVEAFIQDAQNNKWNGVQYHLKLKPQSTKNIFGLSFAEIDTEYGADYSVSGKPIQINGKLDSTSYILDVVPMLKWIIRGGLGRDVDTINVDNGNSNIFADGNQNLKQHNLLRYLSQSVSRREDPLLNLFKDIINELEFAKGLIRENKKKLTDAFNNLSDSEKSQILKDPRRFIFENIGLLSKMINGKLNIVKNLNDAQDIIYLNDNILFRRSSDLNNVYTLTDEKKVIPVSRDQFLNMTKGLKPSVELQTLAQTFQLLPEPSVSTEFDVKNSLNNIANSETFKNSEIDILDKTEIEKNIQAILANPNRMRTLLNIYTKDPNKGWVFTENGEAHATLLAMIGNKKYRELTNNPENHALLLELLDELNNENADLILYIVELIQELNNNICSLTSPF